MMLTLVLALADGHVEDWLCFMF